MAGQLILRLSKLIFDIVLLSTMRFYPLMSKCRRCSIPQTEKLDFLGTIGTYSTYIKTVYKPLLIADLDCRKNLRH